MCIRDSGWDYLSNQKLPYPEKVDRSAKAAFWIEGVAPGRLAARHAALGKRAAGAPRGETFRELVADPLDRELLLLDRGRLAPADLPRLAAALREVGHPGAVYWSLLAAHRGIPVPPELRYPALCDPVLGEKIDQHYLAGGRKNLLRFEYWWRKARPLVRFDRDSDRFVLTVEKVNVY